MRYYYVTFWHEHILRGKYSVVFRNTTQISPNVCRLSKYDEGMKHIPLFVSHAQLSFLIIHKIGSVGITVLLKVEIKLDRETSHFNFMTNFKKIFKLI